MPDLQYAPLKSWIITGAIFFVLFATLHVLALKYNDAVNAKRYALESQYILQHAISQETPEQKRILVIGSSLVAQGISCPQEFSDALYQKIDLRKIFLNTYEPVINYFLAAHVFDSILQHPPHILLIEVDQLTYRIHPETTWIEQWSRGIGFLRNVKATAAFEIAHYRMPDYCGKIVKDVIKDSLAKSSATWQVVSYNDLDALHPYLQQLQAAGVRIILLHVPRTRVAEKEMHSGSKEKDFQALLHRYQKTYHMEYWDYPSSLPYAYYYDQGHLNEKGRAVYSQWLYNKIQNLVR